MRHLLGFRIGVAAIIVTASVAPIMAAQANAPGAAGRSAPSAAAPSAPGPAARAPSQSEGSQQSQPSTVSQDAAARSRMHECGHQWSAMKKAGTVGTLTWKTFSATCLVVSR